MSTPSTPVLESPPAQDAALSSGPSPTSPNPPTSRAAPTVHVIGAGKVGRAFLRRIADLPVRLVAVSDRSATVFAPAGLDGRALAGWKDSGRPFAAHPRAAGIALELALSVANAEIVVDASDSGLAPAARDAAGKRTLALLRRGAHVALAAKTPLLADADELLRHRARLGVNAALGGTGRALFTQLDELRARAGSLACVPNATTTALVTALECGDSFEAGLAHARALGLLEHDPEQDLDGRDAALKLALVARLVFGGDPRRDWTHEAIARPALAELDPALLARRRARGATTRLVGRATRAGELSLAWEEVAPGSALAVPASHVVYAYALEESSTRVHLGGGIGPEGAASALLADVQDALPAAVRRAVS